ncbi:hypothetical protein BGZ65_008183 [Modicella reniformis]|uniref:Uncharacterized protein n=1 Tax=Modicella reniformis TaxID=1440133 RepID=A0A9P6IJE4_9FUNG|nr:hypothetical protein BGZ65_008183 [Modicella reniformis]
MFIPLSLASILILALVLSVASSAPHPTSTASNVLPQDEVSVASLVRSPAPTPHARRSLNLALSNMVADDSIQELGHVQVSKEQLEKFLGLLMNTTFSLEVFAEDKGLKDMGHQLMGFLGKIPVHLKVGELKVGGVVVVPRISPENLNQKTVPVNLSKIHGERGREENALLFIGYNHKWLQIRFSPGQGSSRLNLFPEEGEEPDLPLEPDGARLDDMLLEIPDDDDEGGDVPNAYATVGEGALIWR